MVVLPPACSSAARAGSAEDYLQRHDALMGPQHYEALMVMTAHRDDGSSKSYRLRLLKSGGDKVRLWFDKPAAAKGQEMLRAGENMWVYLPSIRKSVRV